MSIAHYLVFFITMLACQSHRARVVASAEKKQTFQLPFFKDAASLDRELGLLRLRQLEDENDIIVLAELTAGYTLQAMSARGEDSQRSLEIAKQYGIQCLRTSSGFESLLQSRGLRITPKAVSILDEEPQLKNCQRWTGIAWSLWLLERGVLGASIDVKSVQAMAPNQPKGSFDYYQMALSEALNLEEADDDVIRDALQKSIEKSVIPHRMRYEQWRLTEHDPSNEWREQLQTTDFSSLTDLENEAIRRVFPDWNGSAQIDFADEP